MNVYCSDIVTESYKFDSISTLLTEVSDMSKLLGYNDITGGVLHEGVISNIFAKIKEIISKIINAIKGLFGKNKEVVAKTQSLKFNTTYKDLQNQISQLQKAGIKDFENDKEKFDNDVVKLFTDNINDYKLDINRLISDADNTKFCQLIDKFIAAVDNVLQATKSISSDEDLQNILDKNKDCLDDIADIEPDEIFKDVNIATYICDPIMDGNNKMSSSELLAEYAKSHSKNVPNINGMNDLDKMIAISKEVNNSDELTESSKRLNSLYNNGIKILEKFNASINKWEGIAKQLQDKGLEQTPQFINSFISLVNQLLKCCERSTNLFQTIQLGVAKVQKMNELLLARMNTVAESNLSKKKEKQ